MFSIIISEKGGAERKEAFDKNEINVGRVQGNDLMLPKGNVSKQHARLLYRDGRFIVTDLKSTNGTYVNGRKIAQATIVREGDKIYIGDFVLRLDVGEGVRPESAAEIPTANPNAEQPAPAGFQFRESGAPPPQQASAQNSGRGGTAQSAQVAPMGAFAAPGNPQYAPEPQAMPSQNPPPMPPPMPSPQMSPRGGTLALSARPKMDLPTPGAFGSAQQSAVQVPSPSPSKIPPATNTLPPGPSGLTVPPLQPQRPSGIPPRPKDSPAVAARRLALVTLVDRVTDEVEPVVVVDEAKRRMLEEVSRREADSMRREEEVPEGVDVDQLARDAFLELAGLGPIGPLLEEEDVLEIYCSRFDQIAVRRASGVSSSDVTFTSEAALRRVFERLTSQEPAEADEFTVERKLARGVLLTAMLPPVSANSVLVLRKKRRIEGSIEDLVRVGSLSRAMGTFLEACVGARANVLVVSSSSLGTSAVLGALASAAAPAERMTLVQETDELVAPHLHVVTIGTERDDNISAIARLHSDRTTFVSLSGSIALAAVSVVAGGSEGVVAGVAAPSLRQGLARVVTQLVLAQSGLSADAAREITAETFDIVVEVHPVGDGRVRVTRISELAGTDSKGVVARDIFVSSDNADGQGFVPTGTMPRVAAEFAQRGVRIDPNLFKRSARN